MKTAPINKIFLKFYPDRMAIMADVETYGEVTLREFSLEEVAEDVSREVQLIEVAEKTLQEHRATMDAFAEFDSLVEPDSSTKH